jgi:hypothetical protein
MHKAVSNSTLEEMGYIPMARIVNRVWGVMNRRIRFRTYGGVRGRGRKTPPTRSEKFSKSEPFSYSETVKVNFARSLRVKEVNYGRYKSPI